MTRRDWLIPFGLLLLLSAGCTTTGFYDTVAKVELQRFMGKWYVIAGRTTFLEKGAHNAYETYQYDAKDKSIDIEFVFNKDSFDGEIKTIGQTGKVYNQSSNAHWKVSPFWPLKVDFLIIALSDDYQWTAIGVPNQKYLWILSRSKQLSDSQWQNIMSQLVAKGYDTTKIKKIPHSIDSGVR